MHISTKSIGEKKWVDKQFTNICGFPIAFKEYKVQVYINGEPTLYYITFHWFTVTMWVRVTREYKTTPLVLRLHKEKGKIRQPKTPEEMYLNLLNRAKEYIAKDCGSK